MVPGLLLGLSLTCALIAVACGGDDGERSAQVLRSEPVKLPDVAKSAPVAKRQSLPDDLRPDLIIVIAPDLEGFFLDCGCSGGNQGGVARLPAVLDSYSSQGKAVVLSGHVAWREKWLANDEGKPDVTESRAVEEGLQLLDQILEWEDWRILVGSRVGALVSRDHRSFLAETKVLDDAILADAVDLPLRSGEARLSLSLEEPDSGEGQRFSLRLTADDFMHVAPLHVSDVKIRGREVAVIGVWHKGNAALRVNDRLGVIYPSLMTGVSPTLESRLRKLVLDSQAASETMVGIWTLNVSEQFTEQMAMRAKLEAKYREVAHAAGKSLDRKLHSTSRSTITNSCAGCHAEAVKAWTGTRHAHAYETIAGAGRQTLAACRSCHTTQANGLIYPDVTCMSCHGVQNSHPTTRCATCHTPETDPNSRYIKEVSNICQGAKDNLSGRHSCARLSFGERKNQ